MLSRIGRFSSRARASASGLHGYQSTGLFACWSRYGLVSCARRLAIVRSELERQFVGQSRDRPSRSNYTALVRSTPRTTRASSAPRVRLSPRAALRALIWPVVISLLVFLSAGFAVDPVRDAATLEGVGEARL